MPTYDYTRETLPDGRWDINHPDRALPMADEIEAALPGKTFIVTCDAGSCAVFFDDTLTAEEQTTLDGVVADHKANA